MGNNVHELWAEAKALFEQMKGNYVSNNEANFFKNIQYKQEHEITGLNDLLISEYENPDEIQYLVPGLQPLLSFACTHSSLKLMLRFSLQGYIPLRLPAICVCICSPLRCETYARFGLHNFASFYPNNSLAQRF